MLVQCFLIAMMWYPESTLLSEWMRERVTYKSDKIVWVPMTWHPEGHVSEWLSKWGKQLLIDMLHIYKIMILIPIVFTWSVGDQHSRHQVSVVSSFVPKNGHLSTNISSKRLLIIQMTQSHTPKKSKELIHCIINICLLITSKGGISDE